MSIVQQCELLGLARSSYYYEPVPTSEENLQLMCLQDEQYTRTPFYGTHKMTVWLHTQGYPVERLWRSMKYEEVNIKDYQSVLDAVSNLRAYFTFYNQERLRQALDYQTPA